MSDNRNLIIEIEAKTNDIIRINRGRRTILAKLSPDNKTITWVDSAMQAGFRKSVEAMLAEEKINVTTVLVGDQQPDIVPANAPQPPKQHKMQGELTPDYLEWLMKWKPIAFQNLMGVELRDLRPGEKYSDDPKENWRRADVIRTDTRPNDSAQGGQYVATRFKQSNQIIARRASHLTFTPKEVFRGDTAAEQAEPYKDAYADLKAMDKKGIIEVVSVKNAAASAGSVY